MAHVFADVVAGDRILKFFFPSALRGGAFGAVARQGSGGFVFLVVLLRFRVEPEHLEYGHQKQAQRAHIHEKSPGGVRWMRSSEQTTDQRAGSTVSLTEKLANGCERRR